LSLKLPEDRLGEETFFSDEIGPTPMLRLMACFVAVALLLVCFSAGVGYADFVVYRLPGTKLVTVFEGKTKVLAGRLVEYTHPTFGAVALSLDDAVIIKAPTRQEEFKRLYQKAMKSNRVPDFIEAAKQAIKRGLLKEFYECCSAAYKIDPQNEVIVRLIEARKKVKEPLGDPAAVERGLRETTQLKKMKVATSAHYVLLHDTNDAKIGRKRQSRAETRLELLETVYESYFMKFAIEGVVLEPPKEHLAVLLFDDEVNFHRYSSLLDPELTMAAGFWSPKDNIGVFYDQGTTPSMRALALVSEDLKRKKSQSRGTAVSQEIAHLSNTFELLVKVSREESDVEVVSHEATHQLAGNTGLMPRGKIGARWAHEGLASYFETPAGAGWGGIGAVNETRLKDYWTIARDPSRSEIEWVISDELFYRAKDQNQAVEAYGQAWALTYFLMETRFEKLIEYYRECAQLEDDATPRARVDLFQRVFGDLRAFEREFHRYMTTLKTDLDRIRDASK
jgi:hypothetical protein